MKILLIMPFFNGYEKMFNEKLSSYGIDVTLENDSLKINFFDTIQKKLFKSVFSLRFDKYINDLVNKYKDMDFDKVILIFGGFFFRSKHIKLFRKTRSHAEFVYYCWDSIKNYPSILKFINLFDRSYSFDPIDCKKYNLRFLPLFFTDDMNNVEFGKRYYDVATIYTFDRYKYFKIKEILDKLPAKLKVFNFVYMPSKKTYWLNKLYLLIHGEYIKKEYFCFNKLPLDKAKEIYNNSKCVIDCPLSNQKGITIRCFEALRSNSKIITTNEEIAKYPFFNNTNIYIYKKGANIKNEFFSNSFHPLDFDSAFSIRSFFEVLLNKRMIEYNYRWSE